MKTVITNIGNIVSGDIKKGVLDADTILVKDGLISKIADGIKQHQEELCDIIVKESGKPIRFARNEIIRAQLTFNWAAEESRRLNGEFIPLDVAPQTMGYYGIVRRFPLGVILGISPFNFPLNLSCHKIGPAIATGIRSFTNRQPKPLSLGSCLPKP